MFIMALNAEVRINNSYSLPEFISSSWWTLRSILFEELLFRGALLVLAMKYLGKLRGIFLSSFVFGIFHWFSYDIFGDIPQVICTLIITGVGGIAFAFAFAQTKSLYLPIGLHFGWNLVTITVFSQGPLGDQLLVSSTDKTLDGWWSLISFFYQIILLPTVTFFYLKIFKKDGIFASSIFQQILTRRIIKKNG
jgi:hypothetical protein